MTNHVNRLEETRRLVEERQNREKIAELLKSTGHEVNDGKLAKALENDPFSGTERLPQVSLDLKFRNGRRAAVPWTDIVEHKKVLRGDGTYFLEMTFRQKTILLFGRGVENIFPFLNDHAVDLEEEIDGDDGDAPYYIERIVYANGGGQSWFDDDDLTQAELLQLVGDARLRPEVLEERASDVFYQRMSGRELDFDLDEFGVEDEEGEDLFGGEEQMNGKPRSMEEMRQSAQHKNLAKERRDAKREKRRLDPSKFRH